QALGVLYTSLNNAAQLTNWKSNTGDPCAESWKGVTCEGTAVVSIQLPDLGIDRTLGYMFSSLTLLKTLDVSGNNIHDALPYQLPPNLTSLGNIPYSIALMYNLNFMNLSRNVIAQNIGDIFNNLTGLTTFGEKVNAEMQKQRVIPTASIVDLKVPPTENSTFERGKTTNSFSQDNIISEGSLGRVYRAYFPNAKIKAVKKIDNAAMSLQEEDNFVEAVSNMSRLRHPNIVPLAGYCAEHGQHLLVYEYIANDYGLAVLTPNTEREVATQLVGSFGYSAPEFALSGINTVKSDVYSFGVVMLELLTVRKPLDSTSWIGEPIGHGTGEPGGQVTIGYKMKKIGILSVLVKINHGEEDDQEDTHEIDDAQTETDTSDDELEDNIGSTSHGKTITRKETRALGGCVMRKFAKLDGTTWKNQPDLLKRDIITKFVNIRDIFNNLTGFTTLDLSNNNLTGDLPNSLSSLSNISTFHVQNNQLTGTLNSIVGLLLNDVNIANNRFSGWMTKELLSIPAFVYDGNSIDNGPAPPPPPFTPPPPGKSPNNRSRSPPSGTHKGPDAKAIILTFFISIDLSRARSEQSLVRWATPQLHDIDSLAKMVDPTLNGMYPAKSLSRFADIIALCVQPEPEFRPPMSEVVQALVRLMQRASVVKRRSSDDSGFIYKTPDHEAYEMSY
nr:protein STRUBBELIG-receptor family 8 [Tanacetum cinerariifolium]